MKIGLIDIGSNTSKLLIAEKKSPISNDRFSVLKQVSLPCRLLCSSPNHSGQIENRELQLLLTCLQDLKKTCLQHEVSYLEEKLFFKRADWPNPQASFALLVADYEFRLG